MLLCKFEPILHCFVCLIYFSLKATLRLVLNGCFKLKRKRRGIVDPEVSSGCGYFVETKEYNKFTLSKGKETEVFMLSLVRLPELMPCI
jgi:hypothetical protein